MNTLDIFIHISLLFLFTQKTWLYFNIKSTLDDINKFVTIIDEDSNSISKTKFQIKEVLFLRTVRLQQEDTSQDANHSLSGSFINEVYTSQKRQTAEKCCSQREKFMAHDLLFT